MAKNNAYTVWVGKSPGVYDSWEEAEKQVKGFPGAKYKGFPNREFAEEALKLPYLEIIKPNSPKSAPVVLSPVADVVIAPVVEALDATLVYTADDIDQHGIHRDEAPF